MVEEAALGWGAGEGCVLGGADASVPRAPPSEEDAEALAGARAVSAGGRAVVAVLADGRVAAWACGERRDPPEWGDGHEGRRASAAAAGWTHAAVVDRGDGSVWAWGSGGRARLGLGAQGPDETAVPRPVRGMGGARVAGVACGQHHTVAVLEGGGVFAWGGNAHGQLGTGDRGERAAPARVLPDGAARQAACGLFFTVVTTRRGGALATGQNKFGQLAQPGRERRLSWCEVPGLPAPVTAVAAGWHHCLAVLEGGDAVAWGRGKFGQLGVVPAPDWRGEPRPFPAGGERVRAVACGAETSYALTDGALLSCGWNGHGALGGGACEAEERTRLLPAPVAGLQGPRARLVRVLAAGGAGAVVVLDKG